MTNDLQSNDDNQKLLLEIIKRYDTYINSCNAKVAIILSYCMAYIGGLGLKLIDTPGKWQHDINWWVIVILSMISFFITLKAAKQAYEAISPQMPSGREKYDPVSLIFFGDVARFPNGKIGYTQQILTSTKAKVIEDLAGQAHALATIADLKFRLLKKSINTIVEIQIPIFILILVIFLFFTSLK